MKHVAMSLLAFGMMSGFASVEPALAKQAAAKSKLSCDYGTCTERCKKITPGGQCAYYCTKELASRRLSGQCPSQ